MSSRCRSYGLREHRSVAKFLARHPEYAGVYARLRDAVLRDPHGVGERMRGRCRGLYRARSGRLRVVYWVEECIVIIERVGLRENIYEGLC